MLRACAKTAREHPPDGTSDWCLELGSDVISVSLSSSRSASWRASLASSTAFAIASRLLTVLTSDWLLDLLRKCFSTYQKTETFSYYFLLNLYQRSKDIHSKYAIWLKSKAVAHNIVTLYVIHNVIHNPTL